MNVNPKTGELIMHEANPYVKMFQLGANELAVMDREFGPLQAAAGFTPEEWGLLTQKTCWTKAERMGIGSIISNMVSITLLVSGLPATSLPGSYVACCIAKIISPCNRLVAAANAPASFDAMSASGIGQESIEIQTTEKQMYALVELFSSQDYSALENFKIDELVQALVIVDQMKEEEQSA